MMKRVLWVLGLVVTVAGCRAGASRGWQRSSMPSHDRQHVFEAARGVLSEHFEVADANFVRGTIETRPQVFERRRSGTLADVRGAGGRWRRTVSFEMDRDGLTVVAAVSVRLEREATEAAVAMTETARPDRLDELPPSTHGGVRVGRRPTTPVWMDVGYDDALARELLGTLAERVRVRRQGDAIPEGQSPEDAAEEARRIGAR
jgi:hypothetical protein